jgi:hypothetical protein
MLRSPITFAFLGVPIGKARPRVLKSGHAGPLRGLRAPGTARGHAGHARPVPIERGGAGDAPVQPADSAILVEGQARRRHRGRRHGNDMGCR